MLAVQNTKLRQRCSCWVIWLSGIVITSLASVCSSSESRKEDICLTETMASTRLKREWQQPPTAGTARGMVQVRSPDSVKTDGISRACTEAIEIFDVMDDGSTGISDIGIWLKKPRRRGTKLMLDVELLLYRRPAVREGKRERSTGLVKGVGETSPKQETGTIGE
jgi:hypothetical protein